MQQTDLAEAKMLDFVTKEVIALHKEENFTKVIQKRHLLGYYLVDSY